jgi:hypothetical protein
VLLLPAIFGAIHMGLIFLDTTFFAHIFFGKLTRNCAQSAFGSKYELSPHGLLASFQPAPFTDCVCWTVAFAGAP